LPSIPGFDFPPVVVTQTTTVVAGSGIVASNDQNQSGIVTGATHTTPYTGFTVENDGLQSGDINTTAEPFHAFQGAGNKGDIIVAKLEGSENQLVPLVYSNVVQNPSFESGSSRWTLHVDATVSGQRHGVNVVSEFPKGVGFDNGDPADLAVPNGERMLHMFKDGETGTLALSQTIEEFSHTSLLGILQFSVASDSAFAFFGSPAARHGMVAVEFINTGLTFYTIAYNFTEGELPKRPPGFPTINKVVGLTQIGADEFQTFTRLLLTDVASTFSYTQIRLWIVTDMEDTLFPTTFDTLWDWFVITTGQPQLELFPTSISEPLHAISTVSQQRSRNFSAVIGTLETYERDFDRSPFFFTPTELDPNTERDRHDVTPFYLSSHAFLSTFENWRSTERTAPLTAVKGPEIADATFAPSDQVINGGFELGDFTGWVVSTGTLTDVVTTSTDIPFASVPDGILPQEGSYFAYVAAPDTDDTVSQYIRQTVVLPQNYESTILDVFFWHHMPSFLSGDRQYSTNLVFSNDGEDVYHLQYTYNGSGGAPVDPSGFTTLGPAASIGLSSTADVITAYTRDLKQDTENSFFTFNNVDIWHIVSSDFLDVTSVVDAFALTVSIDPSHLLQTSSFAHVNTNAPVTSGIPFTITNFDEVNSIDQTPPFFDETAPVSGTTYNVPDGVLSFHVKDTHSSLDTSNVDVWVDDVQIVNASTVQTSTTWPSGDRTVISPRDIQYDFTRNEDYPQQSIVTVSGELTDLADPVSNQSITTYQFSVLGSGVLSATISGAADGDPPVLSLVYPEDLDTQVSPDTTLSWNLTDDASGVDPVSVRLLINGSVKIVNDAATAGSFSKVVNAGRGFDYVYTTAAPFTFGETVTGTIEASDNVGNSTSTDYEFTITPADTLSITDFFIDQGSSILVTTGTEISVAVEDLVYGVSTSGTDFLVDGVVPSGLVITTSGLGPDRVIYSVPSENVMTDRLDVSVFVHAENNFPGPFPVIKEQTFLLHAGYDVDWPNRSTGTGSGAEEVFPFISNIQVLSEVKNFGKKFNEASLFYDFLTESLQHVDLGASIISNIQIADLPASLDPQSTHFEYGKTIDIEVEVFDNEGNRLSFTHTFIIQDK